MANPQWKTKYISRIIPGKNAFSRKKKSDQEDDSPPAGKARKKLFNFKRK